MAPRYESAAMAAERPSFTATVSAITDAFGDPRGAASTVRRDRRTRAGRRGHGGRRRRARSACIRTSLATISTSSPPAATSRSSQRPRRRRRGRPTVEALRRGGRRESPSSRCAATISCCRCSVGRSPCCRRRGRGDGRGGRRRVRPGDGGRADRRRARRRPALAALGDAGGRRRAHRPRVRRPHADSRNDRPADHQRPLPVRRRGDRAPGDLCRRPGHGARACSGALPVVRRSDVATEASLPKATRSARPRSRP